MANSQQVERTETIFVLLVPGGTLIITSYFFGWRAKTRRSASSISSHITCMCGAHTSGSSTMMDQNSFTKKARPPGRLHNSAPIRSKFMNGSFSPIGRFTGVIKSLKHFCGNLFPVYVICSVMCFNRSAALAR